MISIQQIPITVWPRGRQPVPPVICYPVVLREGVIEIDWPDGEAPAWLEDLPDGLYLREVMDLDLDDEPALARYVATYGWFCKPGWGSLPAHLTREGWGIGALYRQLAAVDALIDGVIAAGRALKGEEAQEWEITTPEFRGFLHVREMRIHVQFLRNAVRVWDALLGNRTLEEVRAQWEGDLGLPRMLASDHWELETAAAVYLQETLNAALSGFHLRLELRDEDLGTDDEPQPTTYEALALQFFGDIATQTPYRRCANEPCGRVFAAVPMREKYNKGTYHGEKYCSVQCSRAQAQRDYRRRKTTKKSGAKGPS